MRKKNCQAGKKTYPTHPLHVPNETTGFSPFQLLCERHIKGTLAILKGEWEEPRERVIIQCIVIL
jgi:hypothetical protein